MGSRQSIRPIIYIALVKNNNSIEDEYKNCEYNQNLIKISRKWIAHNTEMVEKDLYAWSNTDTILITIDSWFKPESSFYHRGSMSHWFICVSYCQLNKKSTEHLC